MCDLFDWRPPDIYFWIWHDRQHVTREIIIIKTPLRLIQKYLVKGVGYLVLKQEGSRPSKFWTNLIPYSSNNHVSSLYIAGPFSFIGLSNLTVKVLLTPCSLYSQSLTDTTFPSSSSLLFTPVSLVPHSLLLLQSCSTKSYWHPDPSSSSLLIIQILLTLC